MHAPLIISGATAGWRLVVRRGPRDVAAARGPSLAALALAALAALLAVFHASLPAPLQAAYMLSLIAPAAALYFGERRDHAPPPAGGSRRPGLWVAGFAAVWVLVRVFVGRHDPRAADPRDMWAPFAWMADLATSGGNPLAMRHDPGFSDAYLVLLGSPLFSWLQTPPDASVVLTLHAVWIVATVVVVFAVLARTAGSGAATVAVAALAGSPFLLLMPPSVGPPGVFTFFEAAVIATLVAVYTRASAAALAALAAAVGLACMTALLYQVVGVALAGIAALVVFGGLRPAAPVAVASALVFFAAVWPSLPNLADLANMSADFVTREIDWLRHERILFGQVSPLFPPGPETVFSSGDRSPLVVAVGAALSPFAIARAPVRLWGDVLFDPVSSALAAVGLAVAARAARHRFEARALLVLLVAMLAPAALTSSYDRVSPTRLIPAFLPVVTLVAVGFAALRHRLFARVSEPVAVAAVSAAALAGGVYLFDVVNPRTMPSSSLALAVEVADAPGRRGPAVLLGPPAGPYTRWLYVDTVLGALPRRPVTQRPFEKGAALPVGDERPGPLLLWSPSLDWQADVTAAVCERWPAATVYTVYDRAGLFRTFAAHSPDVSWKPPLSASRWSATGCGDSPSTSRQGARRAVTSS